MNHSSLTTIRARAATRIDLAGGTLDIWPLYLFHQPAVTVNLAIGLFARVVVTPLPGTGVTIFSEDRCLEVAGESPDAIRQSPALKLLSEAVRQVTPRGGVAVHTRCSSPAGAGLGGSSALAVAAVSALSRFSGQPLEGERLLETAMGIETTILGVPTGKQDYYPALLGGCLALHWGVGGTRVERLPVDLARLGSRILVAYTGEPRESGVNNWEVLKSRIEKVPETIRRLEAIAASALEMREALLSEDDTRIAGALSAEWEMRRGLAPGISTPAIDGLMRATAEKGCLAAKVCGAGGGGCVLFYAAEGRRDAVEETLRREGAEVLDAPPAEGGLEVD